jgi:hypothetical protein
MPQQARAKCSSTWQGSSRGQVIVLTCSRKCLFHCLLWSMSSLLVGRMKSDWMWNLQQQARAVESISEVSLFLGHPQYPGWVMLACQHSITVFMLQRCYSRVTCIHAMLPARSFVCLAAHAHSPT